MRSNKKVLILVVLVGMIVIGFVISVFLGGFSEMKIGYVEDGYGNTMSASFKYYNGEKTKKISFDKKDEVTVKYNIELEEGSLNIDIEDQDGNKVFSKNEGNGEVKFKVDEESSYKISFKADKAKGSYSVSIE